MKKILLLLVLLATVFAGYHFIPTDSQRIEKDITARLADSLGAKNFGNNIQTKVSGRDVTLSGVVANDAVKDEVASVAKSLYGVRTVDNNLVVAGSASKPAPVKAVQMPKLEPKMDAKLAPVMDKPLFDLEAEMPKIVEKVVEVPAPVVSEPAVALEPVVQAQSVTVSPEPVVTYAEEEPARIVKNIKLDGPLPVKNGRVIRREVDTRIASKTVEAACEDDLTDLMRNNKILFDSAKATIQSKSYPLLDRLVVAAKNCDKTTIITINGYTDNEGDAEYNRKLSLDRARAVGKYMLKRGVAKRVKVVGHGENNPVASNDTEEGMAQNRRIEFKVFTD
jgi:outer membrane protein OmpA-like peptidoglycan-associated protein